MAAEQIPQTERHARRIRTFDVHLAIFVVVLGGIALLNWVVIPRVWWMAFPAIGWGVVLAVNAVSVFTDPFLRSATDDRKTPGIAVRDPGVVR